MTANAKVMLPQAKTLRRMGLIHNYDNAKEKATSDAPHRMNHGEHQRDANHCAVAAILGHWFAGTPPEGGRYNRSKIK